MTKISCRNERLGGRPRTVLTAAADANFPLTGEILLLFGGDASTGGLETTSSACILMCHEYVVGRTVFIIIPHHP